METKNNFITFIYIKEKKLKIQSIVIEIQRAKFSITGKDFITNKLVGVGGYDGKTSGEVASNVAGSKLVMIGYAGVAAFTPYRSVIVRQA